MTRQRAVGITVAVGLLLVLAWYFLLWSPQGKKLSAATKRRDDARTQTQQLQAQLQRLKAAQQNEAAKLAQLERLTAAIPDQPNLAQFILDTNNAAAQSGVTFLSISPSPPAAAAGAAAAPAGGAAAPAPAAGQTPAGGGASTSAAPTRPAEIRLSLSVTGGYFQVLDFMNRLDQLPRLIVIDTLTVSPGAATSGKGVQLSVALTGRMFVNPAAAAGATAGAAGSTTTTVPSSTTTSTAPSTAASTTPTTSPGTRGAGATTTTAGR